MSKDHYKYIDGTGYFDTEYVLSREREIERLNELVKGLREERDYLFNKTTTESNYEIKRLNNIINKLEKWLVNWREMLDCPDFYEEGIIDCINDTLNKLQELKGVDEK